MIESVTCIIRIFPSEGRPIQPLFGSVPASASMEQLLRACGEKPVIRKFGEQLLVTLPEAASAPVEEGDDTAGDVASSSWVVWLFDQVPSVTELPDILDRLKPLTDQFPKPEEMEAPQSPADDVTPLSLMLKQLKGATRRKPAALLQLAADACVEAGICDKAVVAELRQGKSKKIAFSDQSLMRLADELKYLIRSKSDENPVSELITPENVQ